MLFRRGEQWEGVGDAHPAPGLQQVPHLYQDQWLRLIRMVMSAGDVETLFCRTEELQERQPIFFRTHDGEIGLSTTGDFDDDDEDARTSE